MGSMNSEWCPTPGDHNDMQMDAGIGMYKQPSIDGLSWNSQRNGKVDKHHNKSLYSDSCNDLWC